jgi:hypothetical protein
MEPGMSKQLYGLDAQLAAVKQCIDRDEDILRICPEARPTREHLAVMRCVSGTLWTLRELVGCSGAIRPINASLSALYAAADMPRPPAGRAEEDAA